MARAVVLWEDPLVSVRKAGRTIHETHLAEADRWAELKALLAGCGDAGEACDLIETSARSEFPDLEHAEAVERLLREAGPELRTIYEQGRDARLREMREERARVNEQLREVATMDRKELKALDANAVKAYRRAAYVNRHSNAERIEATANFDAALAPVAREVAKRAGVSEAQALIAVFRSSAKLADARVRAMRGRSVEPVEVLKVAKSEVERGLVDRAVKLLAQ